MYEKEIAEYTKNRSYKKKMTILIVVGILLIILAGVGGFLLCVKLMLKKEPEVSITSTTVSQKLEEVSDLTTEKIVYQGYIHYEDGDIPFITKKSYTMTYTAEIEAGIDVEDIVVHQVGDYVVVELPDSEVQSVYVDPDSIEFHDESFALFNWDSKEDGVEAVKLAEEDAKENANITELIESADDHARELIENLFREAITDGNVVVD